MTHRPNEPEKDDAVLGGQAAMPSDGLVLGGLEGLKQRLSHPSPEQRITALEQAMQQGQAGVALVIAALRDESPRVSQVAYLLLRDRPEPSVKKALRFYSRSGHDYANLAELLAKGRWREADQTTKTMIGRACGLLADEILRPRHLSECPCEDLKLIDRLWRHYSRNRFGFSVQANIWNQYYTLFWDKGDVWGLFGDRVGWRQNLYVVDPRWKRYQHLTFNLNAPIGHLPHMGDQFGIFTVEEICRRLNYCQN